MLNLNPQKTFHNTSIIEYFIFRYELLSGTEQIRIKWQRMKMTQKCRHLINSNKSKICHKWMIYRRQKIHALLLSISVVLLFKRNKLVKWKALHKLKLKMLNTNRSSSSSRTGFAPTYFEYHGVDPGAYYGLAYRQVE